MTTRTLPATWSLPRIPTWLLIPAAALIGLVLTYFTVLPTISPPGEDWRIIREAALNLDSNAYASGIYTYTPLFTYLFAVAILPLGFPLVAALHLVVLPVLRDRWLIAFALVTPALWMTMALGNVLWFTIVTGILALRGSRWAAVATVVIFVLLPRPLMAPLVIWLLWKQPWLRLPAAGIVVAGIIANLLTGYTAEWLVAAVNFSGDRASRDVWDWGPTRLLGSTWLVIGVPLAIALTRKGHVGLAGMAIVPYLAPVYLLALLFELEMIRRPVTAVIPGSPSQASPASQS